MNEMERYGPSSMRHEKELLLVYPADPYAGAQGGGVRHVQMIAEYLGTHLPKVVFLGVHWGNPKSRPQKPKRKPSFRFVAIARGWVNWPIYMAALVLRLIWSRPRPDVVMVFHPIFVLPLALIRPRTPIVLAVLGETFEATKLRLGSAGRFLESLYRPIEKAALLRCKKVLAAGERVGETIGAMFPDERIRSKIQVIRSAVDLSVFHPYDVRHARDSFALPNDIKVILFAGRLEPVKNVAFLLSVQKQLNLRETSAHLVVAGDGSERRKLERQVETEGIQNVIFLGRVPAEQMPMLLSAADVLVICSRSEGSPVIARESLACGVPVISADVGDVKTVVGPRVGAVVSRSVPGFLEGIEAVLSRDRRTQSAACRESSSRFSPEVAFAGLENLV